MLTRVDRPSMAGRHRPGTWPGGEGLTGGPLTTLVAGNGQAMWETTWMVRLGFFPRGATFTGCLYYHFGHEANLRYLQILLCSNFISFIFILLLSMSFFPSLTSASYAFFQLALFYNIPITFTFPPPLYHHHPYPHLRQRCPTRSPSHSTTYQGISTLTMNSATPKSGQPISSKLFVKNPSLQRSLA